MKHQRLFKSATLLLVALTVGLSVYAIFTPIVLGQDSDSEAMAAPLAARPGRVTAIEIAEDFTRFVGAEAPVFEEDGLPAYGNDFVTQGYIYPAGTLTCEEGACNGVLEDGSPEFPDLVMGEWTCWGYHISDGAHTVSGPIVVTTQLFDFGQSPGSETLVSVGYERMDVPTPFLRAITGGTGRYYAAAGEQLQSFLGFNGIDGVSLQIELDITR